MLYLPSPVYFLTFHIWVKLKLTLSKKLLLSTYGQIVQKALVPGRSPTFSSDELFSFEVDDHFKLLTVPILSEPCVSV